MIYVLNSLFSVEENGVWPNGMAEWLRRSLAEWKVPGSNITTGKSFGYYQKKKKKKKKKRPAILCLHDGSPDDGSAPQLVKRPGCVPSCLCDWCT